MPRVSVIVPVYNTAKYLERCIASIVGQSFRDFEVIIVDDGSLDNSFEVCEKLISNHSNMRVVRKVNEGLSSARLYGLKESTGDYIVFVDSDDYLSSDYLSTLFDAIDTNNADVSMGAYFTDNGRKQIAQSLYIKQPLLLLNHDEIFEKYMLPQLPSIDEKDVFLPSFMWLRMFRRELLTVNLFLSERMVYQEDLALSALVYSKIDRLVLVNKPIYYYCLNNGSLTLRYRENAWAMMCNLYEQLRTHVFLHNSETVQNRKKGFLFKAIMFALRNASLNGFVEFIQLNKIIRSNISTKWLFKNTSIISLCHQNRTLYVLFWIGGIPLLFFYYRFSLFYQRASMRNA